MAQYSTEMIFAVLDVSLIMGLNIGETDKVFFSLITYKNVKCHLPAPEEEEEEELKGSIRSNAHVTYRPSTELTPNSVAICRLLWRFL